MRPNSTSLKQRDLWDNPIALDGEEIVFVQRKHWLVLIPPLFFLSFLSFLFFISINTILIFLSFDPFFLIINSFFMFTISATFFSQIITEWYFEVYVLTNRRLLEFRYTPLNSYTLNDVLLEQVRCTEIDTQTFGILNKYLDIGDITITFDRPTHQEAFTLYSIKNFHKLSQLLCTLLLPIQQKQTSTIWYKGDKTSRKMTPLSELLSKNTIFGYPSIRV